MPRKHYDNVLKRNFNDYNQLINVYDENSKYAQLDYLRTQFDNNRDIANQYRRSINEVKKLDEPICYNDFTSCNCVYYQPNIAITNNDKIISKHYNELCNYEWIEVEPTYYENHVTKRFNLTMELKSIDIPDWMFLIFKKLNIKLSKVQQRIVSYIYSHQLVGNLCALNGKNCKLAVGSEWNTVKKNIEKLRQYNVVKIQCLHKQGVSNLKHLKCFYIDIDYLQAMLYLNTINIDGETINKIEPLMLKDAVNIVNNNFTVYNVGKMITDFTNKTGKDISYMKIIDPIAYKSLEIAIEHNEQIKKNFGICDQNFVIDTTDSILKIAYDIVNDLLVALNTIVKNVKLTDLLLINNATNFNLTLNDTILAFIEDALPNGYVVDNFDNLEVNELMRDIINNDIDYSANLSMQTILAQLTNSNKTNTISENNTSKKIDDVQSNSKTKSTTNNKKKPTGELNNSQLATMLSKKAKSNVNINKQSKKETRPLKNPNAVLNDKNINSRRKSADQLIAEGIANNYESRIRERTYFSEEDSMKVLEYNTEVLKRRNDKLNPVRTRLHKLVEAFANQYVEPEYFEDFMSAIDKHLKSAKLISYYKTKPDSFYEELYELYRHSYNTLQMIVAINTVASYDGVNYSRVWPYKRVDNIKETMNYTIRTTLEKYKKLDMRLVEALSDYFASAKDRDSLTEDAIILRMEQLFDRRYSIDVDIEIINATTGANYTSFLFMETSVTHLNYDKAIRRTAKNVSTYETSEDYQRRLQANAAAQATENVNRMKRDAQLRALDNTDNINNTNNDNKHKSINQIQAEFEDMIANMPKTREEQRRRDKMLAVQQTMENPDDVAEVDTERKMELVEEFIKNEWLFLQADEYKQLFKQYFTQVPNGKRMTADNLDLELRHLVFVTKDKMRLQYIKNAIDFNLSYIIEDKKSSYSRDVREKATDLMSDNFGKTLDKWYTKEGKVELREIGYFDIINDLMHKIRNNEIESPITPKLYTDAKLKKS